MDDVAFVAGMANMVTPDDAHGVSGGIPGGHCQGEQCYSGPGVQAAWVGLIMLGPKLISKTAGLLAIARAAVGKAVGLASSIADSAIARVSEAFAAEGAGKAGDVVYHYTTEAAAEAIQRTGLWSQSSATDVGTYTAQEATELLGVKTPAEVVIEIRNGGQFIANKPGIVQPHPLGPGGGLDLINPSRLSPQSVISIRPVRP
jgi:hypothetical protein